MVTLRAGNAAGSLKRVKKYYNHETRETFFYHWCEDRNLGNPLFNVASNPIIERVSQSMTKLGIELTS